MSKKARVQEGPRSTTPRLNFLVFGELGEPLVHPGRLGQGCVGGRLTAHSGSDSKGMLVTTAPSWVAARTKHAGYDSAEEGGVAS